MKLFWQYNIKHIIKYNYKIYAFYSELVAELPFTLMHPKPEEDRPSSSSGSHKSEASTKENGEDKSASAEAKATTDPLVDTNLIQLDT